MPDKKLIIGMLICFAGFQACEESDEIKLPPDEVLIDLVYDLHSAEASLARVNTTRHDSIATLLRQRVADSHGITAEEMDVWLETLQRSPQHLELVYDSVIARFERQIKDKE